MTPAPLWLLTSAGRTRATSFAGLFPVAPPRVRRQDGGPTPPGWLLCSTDLWLAVLAA